MVLFFSVLIGVVWFYRQVEVPFLILGSHAAF